MKSPLRILHLEDDPTDAELIQAMLETEGIICHVTRVETQADFFASLEQGGFDLILADYTLPSFDGLSALKITLEKCPDVPFIFVSGTLGEEVAIEALKIGATDYVLKERLSRIVPSVHRALREAKERAERKRAEALLAGEKRLLEMIAKGNSLSMILDALCRLVEELSKGSLASILLLDPDGNRLWHGAAPSLPKSYIDAIDGGFIGPAAGSCGTAAYRKEPVIVSDIARIHCGPIIEIWPYHTGSERVGRRRYSPRMAGYWEPSRYTPANREVLRRSSKISSNRSPILRASRSSASGQRRSARLISGSWKAWIRLTEPSRERTTSSR